MEAANISSEIASLPPEAQRQVVDFIDFLKARYPAAQLAKQIKQTDLADEPFIGMWLDHNETQDSTAWVRRLRQSEWEPGI